MEEQFGDNSEGFRTRVFPAAIAPITGSKDSPAFKKNRKNNEKDLCEVLNLNHALGYRAHTQETHQWEDSKMT